MGYGGLGYNGLGYSSRYGSLNPTYRYATPYSNYGYSNYSSPYSYYQATPGYSANAATVYNNNVYSNAVPQASQSPNYSVQSPPQPVTSTSDLRPGMVLPDGAVVISVGPLK